MNPHDYIVSVNEKGESYLSEEYLEEREFNSRKNK